MDVFSDKFILRFFSIEDIIFSSPSINFNEIQRDKLEGNLNSSSIIF